MRQILFVLGCLAIAGGVAMVYLPAGIIVAGAAACLVAVMAERDAPRAAALAELSRLRGDG
jgi:hypothetical protein